MHKQRTLADLFNGRQEIKTVIPDGRYRGQIVDGKERPLSFQLTVKIIDSDYAGKTINKVYAEGNILAGVCQDDLGRLGKHSDTGDEMMEALRELVMEKPVVELTIENNFIKRFLRMIETPVEQEEPVVSASASVSDCLKVNGRTYRLKPFDPHNCVDGIFYRAITKMFVRKAQCDGHGNPTGLYCLTASLGYGFRPDLTWDEASEKLAARKEGRTEG